MPVSGHETPGGDLKRAQSEPQGFGLSGDLDRDHSAERVGFEPTVHFTWTPH